LNTLRLGPVTIVDARIAWRITDRLALYVAADNLFNAAVASTESADHVINYSTPRILGVGLSLLPDYKD
jgi:outer membrane receptor protein involved in Fe transport